jgi:hypothetical protein
VNTGITPDNKDKKYRQIRIDVVSKQPAQCLSEENKTLRYSAA